MKTPKLLQTKVAPILALAICVLLLSGCMPHSNPYAAKASSYGFWYGLWHGLICPFTLILSLFTDVNFYEVHNTGWWYNLGFLLGASTTLGGGGRASR